MKMIKKLILLISTTLLIMPLISFAQTPPSNILGQSNLQAGPITICSDALSYDQIKNELIYEGNVTVMQIKGLTLSCNAEPSHQNANTKTLAYLGAPSTLTDYNSVQKKELETAKLLCQKQGSCRYMSGQKLIVHLNSQGQADNIRLIADDQNKKLPIVNYYSLTTNDKAETTASYAYGKLIEFLPQKNLLTLDKNAFIKQKNNIFSGEKITYNTESGVITVPKQGYQRAMMVIPQEETNKISEKKT